MADPFESNAKSAVDPATKHFTLAANAGADLASKPRAIYCYAAGSITIRDEDGTDLPYAMNAGDMILFRGVRIMALTGTFYGWV